MKILYSVAIILVSTCSLVAQWHDANWLYGSALAGDPNHGSLMIKFKENPQIFNIHDREMPMYVCSTSWSDSTGSLLFYSNGMHLSNYAHEMVENSDSLNPNWLSWVTFGGVGHLYPQAAMFLPWPGHPNQIYLTHMMVDELPDQTGNGVSTFFYSVIDMDANAGLGTVLEKNQVLLEADQALGMHTAVKHANGQDWWIITCDAYSKEYYVFLLGPAGIELVSTQDFGSTDGMRTNGLLTFSPDGTRFARLEGPLQEVLIYDFDRCTGTLSNEIVIPTPYINEDVLYSFGHAFSPNSQYLYFASALQIFQLDLNAPDIAASVDTVAVYDGYADPFSAIFYLLSSAPDGRIYISARNGTKALHTIEKPNKAGVACKVLQPGLLLPYYNAFTSPHYPNFRLGPLDGSPCDTLGLDNHPLARFRYDWPDSVQHPLTVEFIDNSFFEPTDWHWDFGDGNSSAEVNPIHEYAASGTYIVCLTVSNANSSDTYCRDVTVEGLPSSALEARGARPLQLFPNPTSTSFTLTLPAAAHEGMEVRITDMYGRELPLPGQSKIRAGTWQHTLDASHLPAGVYWVSVHRDGGEVYGGKLVVQ
jgi:hypothetical protein